MKNSADLGGCYLPWPSASVDNTLLDLQNSSYPTQPHSIIAKYTILLMQEFQSQSCKRQIWKGGPDPPDPPPGSATAFRIPDTPNATHDALRLFNHFMSYAFVSSTVSTVIFIRRFSGTELNWGKFERSPVFLYASFTPSNFSLLNRFRILSA